VRADGDLPGQLTREHGPEPCPVRAGAYVSGAGTPQRFDVYARRKGYFAMRPSLDVLGIDAEKSNEERGGRSDVTPKL
jgi:hypothetical protein